MIDLRWPLSLLGLALVVFAVAGLSGPGRIDIEDGQARFEAGLNLLDHGEPSIRDPRVVWHRFPGRGGHDFTYYRFPGEFVAAASILVADHIGPPVESWRHFVFSFNGAMTASFLAILFAMWFRRQGHDDRSAILWAFGGIVCTPCWYYAASTFDDLLGTLFVVLALVAAERSRERVVWLLVAALSIALALNSKQPLAAVLLPSLALADRPGRGRIVRAMVLCLGFVVGYTAYVGYEAWKFPPEEKAKHAAMMADLGITVFEGNPVEALLDYAVGPSSGVIWYGPTIILGIAGVLATRRKIAVAMVLAIAAMVGFFALLTFYKGGVCWGPRYLTPIFGMLWLYAPVGAARLGKLLTVSFLAVGFAVQVMGLAVVPERLYVEKDVPTGFYTIDPWLYFQPSISHMLNRPREIVDASNAPKAGYFSPGPTHSFTMPVFDPPYYAGPKGIEGVRRYQLLNGFRPWLAQRDELHTPQKRAVTTFALFFLLGIACLRPTLSTSE